MSGPMLKDICRKRGPLLLSIRETELEANISEATVEIISMETSGDGDIVVDMIPQSNDLLRIPVVSSVEEGTLLFCSDAARLISL